MQLAEFLIEPKWLLAFFVAKAHLWLTINLVSARTSKSFLAKLFFRCLAFRIENKGGISFVEFRNVPMCPFHHLFEVLLSDSATIFVKLSPYYFISCKLADCMQTYTILSSRSLTEVKQYWCSISTCRLTSHTDCKLLISAVQLVF